jgi:hypothetical protein
MDWARILAFVTGIVDPELLARNEYLAAENRILKAKLKGRLRAGGRPHDQYDIGRMHKTKIRRPQQRKKDVAHSRVHFKCPQEVLLNLQ